MSARSRDLISATLITAGIPCAGEVHMAAGASTGPFADYWKDWFDLERWHTGSSASSTGDIQRGYDRMSSGRNDVLLVSPETHHVSTALTWSKDNTHLVGAGGRTHMHPSALIQPHGAVSPLITVACTGAVFSGLTLRNGQSTGSTACVSTLLLSTGGSYNFTMRNSFIWGPEDDSVNDSTSGWSLIKIGGDFNLFEDCLIGYGWPIAGEPTASSLNASLLRFQKSVYTGSEFRNCFFQAEFKVAAQAFIIAEYSPAANVFWVFRNCQFFNAGSTASNYGIRSDQAGAVSWSGGQTLAYFDADCAFAGVTDVGAAAGESYAKFSPAMAQSTDAAHVQVGLALSYDHTS